MHSHLMRFTHSGGAAINTFDKIFSPRSLPIIGHSYLFIPKIGKFSVDRFTDSVYALMKENNVSVMKLMLKGQPMVFTISPEDTRTMYQKEGKFPIRGSMDAMKLIRETNKQSVGVVASNGEDWYNIRSGVNLLLKRPLVQAYHERHKTIAKLHVDSLSEEVSRNNDQLLRDVTLHCTRYTLDAISLISPVIDVSHAADKKEVLKQNQIMMDAVYKTMREPPFVYQLLKTEAYRKLESANNYFYGKIESSIRNMDLSREPFLKALFDLDHLSYKDKVITAMDIFLGGIDATATTIAMTLHYLSMDNQLQELIVEELSLPHSNDYRLLKACVKETLRMSATAGGNGRYIQHDGVIGGYQVPKGTSVLSLNPVMGLLEEHFPSPLQYKPQRWLRQNKTKHNTSCPSVENPSGGIPRKSNHIAESTQENESVSSSIDSNSSHSLEEKKFHPFASLPFGFGPRMCPGKFIAEQEMVLFLAEILKSFSLQAVDKEPLGMIFRTNRVPDRIINIKFIKR